VAAATQGSPTVYDDVLLSAHMVQHLLLIVGTEPIRWRLPVFGRFLLLLVTMPVHTLVGVVLVLASHQLFPAYADLHRGGLVMLAGAS
jgi:cytochrome c oxidase assembly factor CtaG